MRIEQLRYLKEIANSHSMHATSNKMHISPQALSAAIKALENELGLPLLERSFQGTILTPVGEEISILTEQFILQLEETLAFYHNTQTDPEQIFELYFSPYDEMDNFAPKLLTNLSHKNHGLQIMAKELSEQQIKQALITDQQQVALAYVYKLNGQDVLNHYRDFVCQPLCRMHYCCRAAKASLLSQSMSISIKTALKYTLLHLNSRNNFQEYSKLIVAFSGTKELPKIFTMKHQEIYREMMINNHGISIIPDIPYKDKSNIEYIYNTIEIPLKENLQRDLCLIYKKDTIFNENTEKFIKILTNYISYTIRES